MHIICGGSVRGLSFHITPPRLDVMRRFGSYGLWFISHMRSDIPIHFVDHVCEDRLIVVCFMWSATLIQLDLTREQKLQDRSVFAPFATLETTRALRQTIVTSSKKTDNNSVFGDESILIPT